MIKNIPDSKKDYIDHQIDLNNYYGETYLYYYELLLKKSTFSYNNYNFKKIL